jgi:hypothetical protein
MSKAKKEAEKKAPKKTEKPVEKKGKAAPFQGPGVLAAIVDILSKAKSPMTKQKILDELAKRFPE